MKRILFIFSLMLLAHLIAAPKFQSSRAFSPSEDCRYVVTAKPHYSVLDRTEGHPSGARFMVPSNFCANFVTGAELSSEGPGLLLSNIAALTQG